MNPYLSAAVDAARAAGDLLRQHFGSALDVNEFAAHDIKLELDVRTQELISGMLLERFPEHAIYGEEGMLACGYEGVGRLWNVDDIVERAIAIIAAKQ